jgi:hypothetical protein
MVNPNPNTYNARELEDGDFVFFVSQLPPRLQKMGEPDLRWEWKRAQNNARIAANLETRAAEMKAALEALDAQGLTLDDLRAFERVQRGQLAFGYDVPEYALPPGHSRADLA